MCIVGSYSTGWMQNSGWSKNTFDLTEPGEIMVHPTLPCSIQNASKSTDIDPTFFPPPSSSSTHHPSLTAMSYPHPPLGATRDTGSACSNPTLWGWRSPLSLISDQRNFPPKSKVSNIGHGVKLSRVQPLRATSSTTCHTTHINVFHGSGTLFPLVSDDLPRLWAVWKYQRIIDWYSFDWLCFQDSGPAR